jgi:hypothetical protein
MNQTPIAKIGSYAKPERAVRTDLTHYWFNQAKTHSGKSSARIIAILSGFSNLDDLTDAEKKMATRYANGSSAMSYDELKMFIERCREKGLLPPVQPEISCIRYRDLKDSIVKSPEPGQVTREIIDFKNQFEARKAALIKALNEYGDIIEAADKRFIPVLDIRSEIGDENSETNHIPDVHNANMRLLAESVNSHHLLTDI